MINTTAEWEELIGTPGNDVLNSGDNGSYLYGEDGDDTLTTGYLSDSFAGQELYAFQFGGNGRDNLSVLIRAETFYSFTQLEGGDDDDVLAVRNDIVNTDADQSALNENFLLGGSGDDQLFVDATLNSVTAGKITNEVYGGDGNDFINMTARILEGSAASTASNYAEGNSGNDTIFLTGSGSATDNVINVAFGGAGADIIVARVAGDAYGESYLDGGSGDDVLQVIGGFYNEMYGGAGNDVLIGGTGTDYMEGGTGADIFVFDLNGGNDIIGDFVVGTDSLRLTGGQTISTLSAAENGTLVTFGDGATVLLQNVTVTDQAQLFA